MAENDGPGGIPNQRLTRARITRRWTQADAARKVGVASGTFARWERGSQRPHPGQIRRLEEVFGLPADELGFGSRAELEQDPSAPADRSRASTREEQRFDHLLDQVREQSARYPRRIREIPLALSVRPSAVQDPADPYSSRGQADHPLSAGESMWALYELARGRLLILGAPGAGKTAFLSDLQGNLLDVPVRERCQAPVLFHLSLWEPGTLALSHWLVGQLHDRFGVPEALGSSWLEQGWIIPLLDGLDTLPDDRRDQCCRAVDAFLLERRDLPVVVACRANEFEALGRPLALRMAVVVQPARRDAVERYLAEPGLGAVRRLLGDDAAMWDLLATPLFLDFAVRTYGEHRAASRPRGPVEQLRRQVLSDYVREQLAKPVLRGAAAPYEPGPSLRWLSSLAGRMLPERLFFVDWMQPRWLPSRWMQELVVLAPTLGVAVLGPVVGVLLLVLASALLQVAGGSYSIPIAGDFRGHDLRIRLPDEAARGVALGAAAGLLLGVSIGAFAYQRFISPTDQLEWSWGELRQNAPSALTALAAALLLAALLGLVWYGLVIELVFITALASVFTLLMYERRAIAGPSEAGARTNPTPRRRWLFPLLLAALLACVLAAANAGGLLHGAASGQLGYRVASGLAIGLSVVVAFGFRARRYDRPAPGTGMDISRRNALRAAWIGVLVAGIPLGVVDAFAATIDVGLTAGFETGAFDGLVLGMGVGLAAALRRGGAAWLRHQLLWRLVVAHGLLPRDIGSFLDDMCQRVLLVRVGDGYRFYHDVLQDYLADLTPGEIERLTAASGGEPADLG